MNITVISYRFMWNTCRICDGQMIDKCFFILLLIPVFAIKFAEEVLCKLSFRKGTSSVPSFNALPKDI